jgi:hypothetical protein
VGAAAVDSHRATWEGRTGRSVAGMVEESCPVDWSVAVAQDVAKVFAPFGQLVGAPAGVGGSSITVRISAPSLEDEFHVLDASLRGRRHDPRAVVFAKKL